MLVRKKGLVFSQGSAGFTYTGSSSWTLSSVRVDATSAEPIAKEMLFISRILQSNDLTVSSNNIVSLAFLDQPVTTL